LCFVALAPCLCAVTCGPGGGLPPEPEYCSTESSGSIEELSLAPHDLNPFTPWQEWGGFRVVTGSQGFDMFMFRAGARGTGDLGCVSFQVDLTDEVTGQRLGGLSERVTTVGTTSGFRATEDLFVILEESRFSALRAHLSAGGRTLDLNLARRMESTTATLPELIAPETGPPPEWTLEADRIWLLEGARRTLTIDFPTALVAEETVAIEPVDPAVATATVETPVAIGELATSFEVVAGAAGTTYLVISTSDGSAAALRVDVASF
jgi:hypothetical protein